MEKTTSKALRILQSYKAWQKNSQKKDKHSWQIIVEVLQIKTFYIYCGHKKCNYSKQNIMIAIDGVIFYFLRLVFIK